MKYVHTNIVSRNWRNLADFYIDVFQCFIVPPIRKQSGKWLSKGTGISNASLNGAHLRLPGHGENGPTLEIYGYKDFEENTISNANTRGLRHIAFEVENVSEVVENVLACGGSKAGEIVTRNIHGVGKITFIYVRDPEGNLIELQSWS